MDTKHTTKSANEATLPQRNAKSGRFEKTTAKPKMTAKPAAPKAKKT